MRDVLRVSLRGNIAPYLYLAVALVVAGYLGLRGLDPGEAPRRALMPSTAAYLAIGGVAALMTFLLTPIVGWFARRVGWVVEPDARRVHKVTTPDVGGIAMFGGFAVAFVGARLVDSFAPLFAANSEPYGDRARRAW